ncbi:hypothetical protein C8F04DRAFT_1255751 [Mycena alexandri]|uniref:Uncharacterized protein n=1 Tax=Mycena alexandri TaxID=1745969 RepID=A0AAD6XB59_9AGAR|nr:hypothetical protein C8F04DRAFT_1255751 [Mycena alexandri]
MSANNNCRALVLWVQPPFTLWIAPSLPAWDSDMPALVPTDEEDAADEDSDVPDLLSDEELLLRQLARITVMSIDASFVFRRSVVDSEARIQPPELQRGERFANANEYLQMPRMSPVVVLSYDRACVEKKCGCPCHKDVRAKL